MAGTQALYLLFAELLEYPTPSLPGQASECIEQLRNENPLAGELLEEFCDWVRQEPLSQVEEIYTSTFDLQGSCCPYVGHHLFGDNYQRSWFMAKLSEGYHQKGFMSGNELPDHVAMILRFLATSPGDEFSRVLLEEGLVPSVGKMARLFDAGGQHPYGQVVCSLYLLLNGEPIPEAGRAAPADVGGLMYG